MIWSLCTYVYIQYVSGPMLTDFYSLDSQTGACTLWMAGKLSGVVSWGNPKLFFLYQNKNWHPSNQQFLLLIYDAVGTEKAKKLTKKWSNWDHILLQSSLTYLPASVLTTLPSFSLITGTTGGQWNHKASSRPVPTLSLAPWVPGCDTSWLIIYPIDPLFIPSCSTPIISQLSGPCLSHHHFSKLPDSYFYIDLILAFCFSLV